MQAFILCGGMGTRLREETDRKPKPMVEIGGRPLLWHLMKWYASHGVNDFVLCLGYRGASIKEYFLDYEAIHSDFTVQLGQPGSVRYHRPHGESAWKVTLADTGLETMTGGRLARAARYLDGDTFLLTYGDGLADVDLPALLAFHRSHGKAATVTGVRPQSRFGELILDGSRVQEFSEKPLVGQGNINGGFFVMERRFLQYVSTDGGCVLEREPLERAAGDGELMMYDHAGFWQCMDTWRDMQLLQKIWESGSAPWKTWSDPA